MNVILAAQLYMLAAGFGGFFNGLRLYGGFVAPKSVRKDIEGVPRRLILPGVFGDVMLGWACGMITFMLIQMDHPVTQNPATAPTWGNLLFATCAGLMGTVFLDKVVDVFQRLYLDKLLQDNTATSKLQRLTKPVQAFKSAPRIAMEYLDHS